MPKYHSQGTKGNIFGGIAEHLSPVVPRKGKGKKKQMLRGILKIANWIYLLNLLAASVYYTRDEVTVEGTFYRFHGISNGNVLSIEAASIAIANPVRGSASTVGPANALVKMLRRLCQTTSAISF